MNKMRRNFGLSHVEHGTWNIVDDNNQRVFLGPLSECEAWLDREERLAQQRLPRPSFLKQAAAWVHHLTSGAVRTPVNSSRSA